MNSVCIERLRLSEWRNLAGLDWCPAPCFNVLDGSNGAGKTSILEAIDYLGALRSFRGAKAAELIRHAASACRLSVELAAEPLARRLTVELRRPSGRLLELDGKRPASFAVWRRHLPTVLFQPGDLSLVAGAAEGRRHYLDRILELTEPSYARTLTAYQHALRSRNRLLRHAQLNAAAAQVYDALLAEHGEAMMRARLALTTRLAGIAAVAFAQVAAHKSPLGLRYASRAPAEGEALRQLLAATADKDRRLRYTSEGPHTDDLVLTLSELDARRQASQGQQRTIVLALKLAEMSCLAACVQRTPIFLLDDVSSELDAPTNRRFFEQLAGLAGQALITTTDRRLIPLPASLRQDFAIAEGSLGA